jgi:hypothetical protein
LLTISAFNKSEAQPYFDVAGASMWQMPASMNGDNTTETEGYFFLSFPFDIGKKSKIVASPFYETRFLETGDEKLEERLQSLTLPIAFLYQLPDTNWTLLAFGALRSNSTQFRFTGDVYQWAGALMVNYRVNQDLVLKTGVYLSKEFYGDFYMWLVGIEWKINSRMNLFGLVNNNLRLEYKFNDRFYGGAAFKAINTSYRENGEGGYYKISDNHLGLYADVVVAKKLVLNLEAGHTIFRYIKSRNGAPFPELNQDGFVFKTGIAYRIRLWE